MNLLVYEQETEQEDLQFTKKLEDSIKKLCYKELNAREAMYEKRINKVTDIFNKQLTNSKEAHRKQFDDLQCKIQNNLQLKIAEFKREVTKTIEDNAESQRKEMLESKHLRDESLKQRIMIEKLKEDITHLKNQIQLTLVLQHTRPTVNPSKSITHQHSMQPQSTSQLDRGLNNKARRVSIKFGDIVATRRSRYYSAFC